MLLGTLAVGCVDSGEEYVTLDEHLSRLEAIRQRDFPQTIVVVDRHGHHLATVARDGFRTWIPLAEIPDYLRMAAVATEDQTFYSNLGVDPSALARAALQNSEAGAAVSGASTITMQLARLVAFGDSERYDKTVDRKVREAQLAAELAQRYDKDEILEAYLNVAYFGHRAYGVEAAANIYFGKHARDLSLAEAALVAGLPQAPAILDPFENPSGALARRRVVLARMVDVGVLSPALASKAGGEALRLHEFEVPPRRARHFVDYVLEELPGILGPAVAARGGFTVTTSLDLELNQRLRAIAAKHVDALREAHDVGDAALVALRPGSGEVLAMVGGTDYDDPATGQVNVAVSPRQPGSAIKPLVYAAALDRGWSPASLLWDVPYQFDGVDGADAYEPRNYDGRFRGPVRLRHALASSLNAATVGLAADVGLGHIQATLGQFGIDLGDNPNDFGLSLALGGAEAPLLDVTAAFAGLADGGEWVAPQPVLTIESSRGGELLHVAAPEPQRAVSAPTAWLITDILTDPEARRDAFGNGGPLATSQTAAVKTGTSNDFRDNLTVGYTPYIAIGVWTGNKDGHPMKDVLGITGAAPIWHDAMEEVMADETLRASLGATEVRDFPRPDGIATVSICDLRTLTVDGQCRRFDEFVQAPAAMEAAYAYGWYWVRGAGAGGCADAAAVRAAGSQILLKAPVNPSSAADARDWAEEQGIAVAPPACSRASRPATGNGPAGPTG